MAESMRRTKLLQAMTYYVGRTTQCGKAKLYWLLYLLDFKNYAATTSSVTGLDYYAGVDGPVPLALDRELDSPDYDFVEQFHFDNLVLRNGRRLLTLHARGPFEAAVFTDFERATMHLLVTVLGQVHAGAIAEDAFLPGTPWRRTYEAATRELEPIDYRLVLPAVPEVPARTPYWAQRASLS